MAEVNGGPASAAPAGEITPDRLRRMNHVEWLGQFAQVLGISPKDHGIPMTPFRAGAISRLRFAATYIALLEADVERLSTGLRASERDLGKALAALEAHMKGEKRSEAEETVDDEPGR